MKKEYKMILLIIISLLCIDFTNHNAFLYKTPILKITKVENEIEELPFSKEISYNQTITGVIENGKYKGKRYMVTSSFSPSKVDSDEIKKNNELLVEISKDGKHINKIKDIKRDKYTMLLLVLVIDFTLLVAGIQGRKILLSLGVNIFLSAFSIFLFKTNYQTINLLLLYMGIAILFIISSLYITNGKGEKTKSAIISSVVSLFISFGISFLLLKLYGRKIELWTMDYIEVVYDYENFFYVSILLSGLGAIMDIAITIASSLHELLKKNPKIKKKSLEKSGEEISKDIIGTMVNVMLYTCYAPIIPLVFLAVKNHVSILNAFTNYGNLEMIIVLCSCISIVLTIPISLKITIWRMERARSKKVIE